MAVMEALNTATGVIQKTPHKHNMHENLTRFLKSSNEFNDYFILVLMVLHFRKV